MYQINRIKEDKIKKENPQCHENSENYWEEEDEE